VFCVHGTERSASALAAAAHASLGLDARAAVLSETVELPVG